MDWKGRRQSDNIEDRRGSAPRGGNPFGRGGIRLPSGGMRRSGLSFKTILIIGVVYLVLRLIGIDPLQMLGGDPGAILTGQPGAPSNQVSPARQDEMTQFVATVLGNLGPLHGAERAGALISGRHWRSDCRWWARRLPRSRLPPPISVVMLGWYGTEELAATVLGSQAFFVVYIFGSGFASAILPLAAQAEGRNDPTHVRRSVRMGMWILLLYAVLVMPFLWFLEPALIGLGQKPELAALASDYIRIAQWAMFPALMMMALRSFFAARSRAGIVLWSALIGTLVNGVLNYALIFGHFGAPEMGVRGAAVASVVSSTVIFLIMAGWAVLHPRHLEYRLFQRFWRPEWPAFFEVFRLGLPIGFTILAEVGLFMAASVMMGWLGTVPLAAHGIAIQLASISFMVPLGLSHAATVRIGQAYGRGDMEGWRARHTR
jgi:putative MATE family efflux protein